MSFSWLQITYKTAHLHLLKWKVIDLERCFSNLDHFVRRTKKLWLLKTFPRQVLRLSRLMSRKLQVPGWAPAPPLLSSLHLTGFGWTRHPRMHFPSSKYRPITYQEFTSPCLSAPYWTKGYCRCAKSESDKNKSTPQTSIFIHHQWCRFFTLQHKLAAGYRFLKDANRAELLDRFQRCQLPWRCLEATSSSERCKSACPPTGSQSPALRRSLIRCCPLRRLSLHVIWSVFGSADALRLDGFILEDILCVFFWQACQSDSLRPLKRADVRSEGDFGERCCPSVVL